MKFLIDLLPAIVFFGAYLAADIYTATLALIVSLFVVVAIYRVWQGQWHKAHLATALIALLLGGLTLYVRDPAFIKFKPTAVYAVFALVLLGSHFIGDKVLLQRIPQSAIRLPDPLWRRVNIAWAVYFLFCAALNWYVAHAYDEASWVKFKTFGFTALTFIFLIGHAPFLSRYLNDNEAPKEAG